MTIKLHIAAIAVVSSLVSFFGHTAHAANTYVRGNCTWYAKQRRPDLPNRLGNANTWLKRAAAMGYPVGSKPHAGAVGTTTQGALGHVVYIESVRKNGTVSISEMNYNGGVGVVHRRVVVASSFKYIYKKRAHKPSAASKRPQQPRAKIPFAYSSPRMRTYMSV